MRKTEHTLQRKSTGSTAPLRTAPLPTAPLPTLLWFALLVSLCALFGCREETLRISPVGDQTVVVGEYLEVFFEVTNTRGEEVELGFSAPPLLNIDRWAVVRKNESGGLFGYQPVPEHVGVHHFSLNARTDSQAVSVEFELEVVAAREAAPVFTHPSAGQAWDLTAAPCIAFEVAARDRDTPELDLTVAAGLPEGATLTPTGPASADFRWCPTPDQVAASEHWLLVFSASDREHDPVLSDYHAILLGPKKENCAGTPPEIEFLYPEDAATVISNGGYSVGIQVTDDRPLRDDPVLFYTNERPEQRDQLDLTRFSVAPFRRVGDHWEAHIPTYRLATDEVRTLTIVPWATDDDDPTGTRCDHYADLRVRRFAGAGAIEAASLDECRPCRQSGDCISGVCLGAPQTGFCVPSCEGGLECAVGECRPWNSAEGVVREGCGDARKVCEGIDPCVDDALEPDDSRDTATDLLDRASGQLCERNDDLLRLAHGAEERVELRLVADGDVELQAIAASGLLLGVTAGSPEGGVISFCAATGTTTHLRVFSPTGDRGAWDVQASRTAEACLCEDDEAETLPAVNLPVGSPRRGVICGGDSDVFTFEGSATVRTTVRLESEDTLADLDFDVIADGTRFVASSRAGGSADALTFDLRAAGTYEVRVFSFNLLSAPYTVTLETTPLLACTDHDGCGDREVCDAGLCREIACVANFDCPDTLICPLTELETNPDAGPDAGSGSGADSRRVCRPQCATDLDCRDGTVCKHFFEGDACFAEGTGQTGAPCTTTAACADDRVCVDWPSGYCAAAGCDRDFLCDDRSLCGVVDGRATCLVNCWSDDAVCGRDGELACEERIAPDSEIVYGCVPEAR